MISPVPFGFGLGRVMGLRMHLYGYGTKAGGLEKRGSRPVTFLKDLCMRLRIRQNGAAAWRTSVENYLPEVL